VPTNHQRVEWWARFRNRSSSNGGIFAHPTVSSSTRRRSSQNFSTVLNPSTAASFSNFPGCGPVGLVASPPGVHEILEVRLQGPAGADFVLIDRRHQRLGTPQRPVRAHQLLKVQIQRARTGRDVGIARGDAELVLGARVAQADEFDAAVGIAVDQVSIRRTG